LNSLPWPGYGDVMKSV